MKRTKTIAGAAAVGVVAIGFGMANSDPIEKAAPTTTSSATVEPATDETSAYTEAADPSLTYVDEAYLATLADAGVFYESNEAAIGLADAVCDYLDTGGTFNEVLMVIHNYGGWDEPTSGYIGGAAIAAYCPEHAGKI